MQFVSVIVCIIFCFLLSIYFPPEEIFCSRVTGAYPVTTDCIVAMTSCENKRNLVNRAWVDYISTYIESFRRTAAASAAVCVQPGQHRVALIRKRSGAGGAWGGARGGATLYACHNSDTYIYVWAT